MKGFREKWAGRFMGCVDVKGLTATATLDEAAREAMAPSARSCSALGRLRALATRPGLGERCARLVEVLR